MALIFCQMNKSGIINEISECIKNPKCFFSVLAFCTFIILGIWIGLEHDSWQGANLLFDVALIIMVYYFIKHVLERKRTLELKKLKNTVESLLQVKIMQFVVNEIPWIIDLPDPINYGEDNNDRIEAIPLDDEEETEIDIEETFKKHINRLRNIKNEVKIADYFKKLVLKGSKLQVFRSMIDFIDANSLYLDEKIKSQLVIIRDSLTEIIKKSRETRKLEFIPSNEEYAIKYTEYNMLKVIRAVLNIVDSKIFEDFFL